VSKILVRICARLGSRPPSLARTASASTSRSPLARASNVYEETSAVDRHVGLQNEFARNRLRAGINSFARPHELYSDLHLDQAQVFRRWPPRTCRRSACRERHRHHHRSRHHRGRPDLHSAMGDFLCGVIMRDGFWWLGFVVLWVSLAALAFILLHVSS
jgi:hypothetical protein